MKKLFFIWVSSLVLLSCSSTEDDGPDHGIGFPSLQLMINDRLGNSLLPDIDVPSVTLDYEQVAYEINGKPYTPVDKDSLEVVSLDTDHMAQEALFVIMEPFGNALCEAFKKSEAPICKATVYLKSASLFRDEKEHVIEATLVYTGDKDYDLLQPADNGVYVDGVQAEPVQVSGWAPGHLWQVNLPISVGEP